MAMYELKITRLYLAPLSSDVINDAILYVLMRQENFSPFTSKFHKFGNFKQILIRKMDETYSNFVLNNHMSMLSS